MIMRLNSNIFTRYAYFYEMKSILSKVRNMAIQKPTCSIVKGSVRSWNEASQEKSDGTYGLVDIRNSRIVLNLQGGRAQHG